jgi:hypothetical protein
MSNCGCEGSCPICRTGEVDDHECDNCKAQLCPTCHGIKTLPRDPWKQMAFAAVEPCSCGEKKDEKVEKTHDEQIDERNQLMAVIDVELGPSLVLLRHLTADNAELVEGMTKLRQAIVCMREKHPKSPVTDFAICLDGEGKVSISLLLLSTVE